MVEKKSPIREIILVLGNMLFEDLKPLNVQDSSLVVMIESKDLATHFSYHKHKILLFFSAMRSYKDYLESQEVTTKYISYTQYKEASFTEKLEYILKENPEVTTIKTYEIEDKFFEKKLQDFTKRYKFKLEIIQSQNFICSREEFQHYVSSHKRLLMQDFYIAQRKKHSILVDDIKRPIGEKWSFDEENRKKLPKSILLPKLTPSPKTNHTLECSELIEKEFKDSPGNCDNFYLPTTRKAALEHLEIFLNERFKLFGDYEDAIDYHETFLFHSILSPLINIGLLNPKEVIDKALSYAKTHNIALNNVEGFVRQLLGWREYMRGIYQTQELELNLLQQQREFKAELLEGKTGLLPFDSAIRKATTYGYTHHIERLMVLGNIFLLLGIHPNQVYKFFMEYFVDSSDWVMVPNVYGMSQFAERGIFATKPYICGSNYIRKMSNYPKGEWCEVLDGLYWLFIEEHKELFKKNPRMNMVLKLLERMNPHKKELLFTKAKGFREKYTKVLEE